MATSTSTITMKVVGTSFDNRTPNLQGATVDEEVLLIPEPHNEHDPFAVGVHRYSPPGQPTRKVGMLPAGIVANHDVGPLGCTATISKVRTYPDKETGAAQVVGIDIRLDRAAIRPRLTKAS